MRGGAPQLDPKESGLELGDLQSGATAILADAEGNSLAFGIHDAPNALVRVLPFEPDESPAHLDVEFLRRRVKKALRWRKRLQLTGPEAAYRLINQEGDGLPGFTVDVYSGHSVIFSYSAALEPYAALLAEAVKLELKPQSVIGKIRPPGETPVGRVDFTLYSEEPPPKTLVVEEDDVKYEVHLQGGLNTGLFCDMRDVRRTVRNLSAGQRVLNLFAYTGSFSVVAALAEAKSVTTVEFAGGVVEWAKTNFALNEIPADHRGMKFVKADVFEFLKNARRRDDLWDLLILDPPLATSAPGRKWFLKSDYDRLIAHALRVLAPGGMMVVASSAMQSRPEGVESQIRHAAKEAGRRLRLVDAFGLPGDFPTQMIHAPSRYLKVFILLAD